MTDAPILSPMNHVTAVDEASDFEKKHTPHIVAKGADGAVKVSVSAGHYVPHPNQPDHYFQWIEIQAANNPVARFDLSPVATDPNVSIIMHLDPDTVVRAVAYCNLHGLWAAEITI